MLKKILNNISNYTLSNRIHRLILLLIIIMLSNQGFAKDCNFKYFDDYQEKLQKYITKHELIAAFNYSDSVLNIIQTEGLENCEKTWWIRLSRGEVLELRKKFEQAIKIYHQIIRISEKNQWWSLTAEAYISLARTYEYLSRSKEELNYLIAARIIISKHHLNTVYPRFCIRYSSYHRLFDNLDSARNYANKAVTLGKKYNVVRSIYDGYLLLGILSSQLDTKIKYFESAVSLFLEKGDNIGAAGQTINIATILKNANRYTDAHQTIERAEYYMSKVNKDTKIYSENLAWLYKVKSSIFYGMNKVDSAYFYLQLYNKYNKKAKWYVNEENIKFTTIDFAIEKEKEKTRYLQRLSSLMKWGLILMGITILIFIILIINNQKRRKEIQLKGETIKTQKDELEKLLNKQTMLLSEVHHRVKNNLQLVISLLILKGNDSKSKYLKQHLEDISLKVRSIALIHEQLYQYNDFESIDIKVYFKNMTNYFRELQKQEDEFNIDIDIENIHMNLETVMPLGIICSELISNSLKHARTPDKSLYLNIKIHQFDNKFVFKFSDNGPGILKNYKKENESRMGLTLIKSLVRQLQAESSVYNENGYHFNMIFIEKQISKI